MTVVTTLAERRREKQWKFERSLLRKLSLKEIKASVETHFKTVVPFYFLSHPFLVDPCMDMAIDAYLLGAEYGRFGYLGETVEEVKQRCAEEMIDLTHAIFTLLQGWLLDNEYVLDSLKVATESFVDTWWTHGFKEAERQYRLRLH
ncbi:YbaK family protein [Alkalihalobacillus oceani]|uniref:YbaK family protein n=1 Tax=Halalkalibacter oceani TaxID=1653776 RepID=UPI00203CB304|nr:YbaK family protein [Halalkalibacter oceani]MCM3762342.1 YbaK family protein [Halalkalibacter oceani]